MSKVQSNVKWDSKSQTLSGWASIGENRIRVRIPRVVIHSISIYNDALEWEIERHKEDIIERLKPVLSNYVVA